MRIIAGKAKGRRINGPPGRGTRPPTGRIREAVFSSLGAAVIGADVLDLYAGSGAFGLEALSRGAASVVFIERDSVALLALRSNIGVVGLGGRVVESDVTDGLNSESGPFALAFVDPPYNLADEEVNRVLSMVEGMLAPEGIVLVHRRRDHEKPLGSGTLLATSCRRYGDAVIWRYSKEGQ